MHIKCLGKVDIKYIGIDFDKNFKLKGGIKMANIYYQSDCNLSVLDGKTVAIIGYGSQGHAHALNLKESGVNVIVGLYEGSKSWKTAEEAGLKVATAAEAAAAADIIMILTPDEKQADIYNESIKPNLKDGDMLMFAHGFNIHFQQIIPPCKHRRCDDRPKGPGHTVRSEYVGRQGVPCLVAIHQDASGRALEKALALRRRHRRRESCDSRNYIPDGDGDGPLRRTVRSLRRRNRSHAGGF